MFPWKVLVAALLIAALLGGIKYVFDRAEKGQKPKD
jgi:hypothetical protein